MYESPSGAKYSYEDIEMNAQRKNMTTEEFINSKGFTLIEDEPGKTKGPARTANAGPETMTADGESSSANTSLGQSEVSRPIITVEDLNQSEGKSSAGLTAKLSAYGIRATEAVAGINGLSLSKVEDSASLGDRILNLNPFRNAEEKLTVQTGEGYGENLKSKEELQLLADQMNQYVQEFGNAGFIKEESERLKGMSQEYDEATRAEEYTADQILKEATASKAEKFDDIQSRLNFFTGEEKLEDFSSKEEFEQYKEWKDTGILPEITDKEKSDWNAERKLAYADNEGKRFSQDLNAVDRFGLLAIKSNEQKLAIESAEDLRKGYENYNEQMASLDKEVENFNNRPDRSQAQLDDLRVRATDLMAEGNRLDSSRDKTIDTLNNAPQALNLLNKDYNLIAKLGTGFKDLVVNSAYLC